MGASPDRKDKDGSGKISRKEFPEVVREAWIGFAIWKDLPWIDSRFSTAECNSLQTQAWGQIPTMVFSDKLGDLYPGGLHRASERRCLQMLAVAAATSSLSQHALGRPGQPPLDGDRVVMFLGRTSPAGWALRSVP